MSRDLPSWAQGRKQSRRPKLTLPRDLLAAAKAVFRRQRPAGAPPKPIATHEPGLRAERPGRHLTLRLLSLRFDIELVGDDSLTGLRQPFVMAANEQGALDYQLLRLSLPSRLRPTMIAPSRALARGNNVVIFTDDPSAGRQVGEFSDAAAGTWLPRGPAVAGPPAAARRCWRWAWPMWISRASGPRCTG